MALGHHAACGFSAPRRLPCAGPSVATAWLGWVVPARRAMRRRQGSTKVDGFWQTSRLWRLQGRLRPSLLSYRYDEVSLGFTNHSMTRLDFAERISSGLAGWLQQLAAQNLEDQVGEDAARVEVVRMISAQRAFVPDTSLRPTNWPIETRKRLDIAVLGRRPSATGWYGAIELKWPGQEFDVAATRQRIIEDVVRVAFAQTSNMGANFLILGGTTYALTKLFDHAHKVVAKETQRTRFSMLLKRELVNPSGYLPNNELNASFPDFGDRVPQTVFNGWERRLRTELVAVASANVGTVAKGHVYVWQCKK
jgi:hypothetical protein